MRTKTPTLTALAATVRLHARAVPPLMPLTALAATLVLTACSGYETREAGVRPALPVFDWVEANNRLHPGERLEVLVFPDPGTTTVEGQIDGQDPVLFGLPARAGQWLAVAMESADPGAGFEVLSARVGDDWGPLAEASGERAETGLFVTADGTYLVRARWTGPLAGPSAPVDYTLTVDRR
jgi:hypothetical protein